MDGTVAALGDVRRPRPEGSPGLPEGTIGRARAGPGSERHGLVEVVLADVHGVVRDGARAQLEQAGGFRVVGEAASAAEATATILALEPDVAVLDIDLEGGHGLEVIRGLRRRGVATRCLVLTAVANTEVHYGAVLAGADGLVAKSRPREEFVAAVRSLARGEQVFDTRGLEGARPAKEDRTFVDFTARERSILALLAEGRTNREIAARLVLAEKTVRNNVSVVLAKLGVTNRTQAATYVACVATDDMRNTARGPAVGED